MIHTDSRLRWLACSVLATGHPDSARLTLYPDGRVRAFDFRPANHGAPLPRPPAPYHVFRDGDFK